MEHSICISLDIGLNKCDLKTMRLRTQTIWWYFALIQLLFIMFNRWISWLLNQQNRCQCGSCLLYPLIFMFYFINENKFFVAFLNLKTLFRFYSYLFPLVYFRFVEVGYCGQPSLYTWLLDLPRLFKNWTQFPSAVETKD